MSWYNDSNMVEPCSYGLYQKNVHHVNSFSNMFSMPYEEETCQYDSSPSSVDCTLSLGTPSTRLSNDYEKTHQERRKKSNWWNILQSSNKSVAPPVHKTSRGSNGGNGTANADTLFSRRCANCDTTSTPLWRNGPRGPKSLCNACGIRFKKEERRANAATSTVASTGVSDTTEAYHHQYMMNGNQWMNHVQPTHKMSSCYSSATSNEFRFMDDVDDRDSSFLSWRLNFTDRPGFVHDFTR